MKCFRDEMKGFRPKQVMRLRSDSLSVCMSWPFISLSSNA